MAKGNSTDRIPDAASLVHQFELFEGEVLHLKSEAGEPGTRKIHTTDEPGEYALIRLGDTVHD